MLIIMKNNFRLSLIILIFGCFSFQSFAQQWGNVEKSTLSEQIGDSTFYLHTVAKGNTFYSLSKVYGVSIEAIKKANQNIGNELKLGSILLIPKGRTQAPKPKVKAPDFNSTDYFYHVVKQGESLYSIAKIFGVGVDDLKQLNQLTSSSISPGFHLKIPELKISQKEIPQKPLVQKPQKKKARYFEYIVQEKETLFSIAKHYGIGIETLKYINNFSSNTIHPGQMVLIPKVVSELGKPAQKNYIIHYVQAKEGLYAIARKYGLSIDQIKEINPNLNNALRIGQEIKIPRQQNSKGYIEHRVSNRKEKLSDIAREYEVSVRNLKALNPNAPSKLRRGETLNIPLDFIDRQKEEQKIADDTLVEKNTEESATAEEKNTARVFNVTMILPLYLDDVDSMLRIDTQELLAKRQEFRAFRFLEFYEGAQIALDSLKKLGMHINFKVYDISENELELSLLLQNQELQNSDLIISLMYSKNFTLLSNYCKEYKIPVVNVLSKRRQIIYKNPYVFKMSPKPDALYSRVADFIGEKYADYNTIIVRNNPYQLSRQYTFLKNLLEEKVKPKSPLSNQATLAKFDSLMKGRQQTFRDTLEQELVKGDYSFGINEMIDHPFDTTWVNNPVKTVIYSRDSLNGIMENASLFRNNLIVALGSDQVFAIELFTKLNFVRDSLKIKVIGLPDWQNFMNLDVEHSQAFGLAMSSEIFVDYKADNVNQFIRKFHNLYNKEPEVNTYAFLGYDATFYFLQALFRLGDQWMEEVPKFQIPLLENQLKFEKQADGGYENTYWNLYRQENYEYKTEK